MALQINKSITHLGNTFVFKNAYVKVTEVKAKKPYEATAENPTPSSASVATVMTFKDKSCLEQLSVYHYGLDFDLSPTAKNNWEQAYTHLKTLPEFIEAVDC